MDFFEVRERSKRSGVYEIYPDFNVSVSEDLMVRGKAFWAIWDERTGMWSTDELVVRRVVDEALFEYAKKRGNVDGSYKIMTMKEFSSGSWLQFKKFMQNMPDTSHQLDERLTFANDEVKKSDYVSHKLPYALQEGRCDAYETIMATLYDKPEREKLEWAVGSIIAGDSKRIQKFIVLYGEHGSGKSTFLNIIEKLFPGYYTMFNAKDLVSQSNQFAMEQFKSNPLVAIQHDGDLSRIEDNTKLNSLVSHEKMVLNEKFKSPYTIKLNCFLFMGTNKPVKITDAKSGLIRRLIDVSPSGRKLKPEEYDQLTAQIDFELGAIAAHCLSVYKKLGKNYYSNYKPLSMIYQTDPFFNYVESYYDEFSKVDGVSLTRAYDMYDAYCKLANIDASYKLQRHKFREELKNYFRNFDLVTRVDGKQVRSWYSGFMSDKFAIAKPEEESSKKSWIELKEGCKSELDTAWADCPAQYATSREYPSAKWATVSTTLSQIDTHKLHYVKPPNVSHIFLDFDLRDSSGQKSLAKNIEAAEAYPPTYAEVSKGGNGLHLHYIYTGDTSQLAHLVDEGIEVKVCNGDSAVRRKLSLCNDLPIATISGGLPLKKVSTTLNKEYVRTDKSLHDMVKRCLNKEFGSTSQCINFINDILHEAKDSGVVYDLTDMQNDVFKFACKSTNQSARCTKLVMSMPFKSVEVIPPAEQVDDDESDLCFYDVEVVPNLLLICWKQLGDKQCVHWFNPSSEQIEEFLKKKLVGFNCRRYDNHIIYGRYLGDTIESVYKRSHHIVEGSKSAMIGDAYNVSYTDVYDFSSKKQSLKKFEIDLGIHHQELGLPWDKPVPEELWPKVAEYCDNDVNATEAVFLDRKADWSARKILAKVAGMTYNDTTNSLTTRIIFGDDRNPQRQFNYRDLGEMRDYETYRVLEGCDPNYCVFDGAKPVFPGYKFDNGKSLYRGEEVGEGGYVYAEPGIYYDVALLDIASMHPSSIVAENLFGDTYTARFKEILDARIAIKHKDFDKARGMLGGAFAPYLGDASAAKDLAQALKIAINSVYGLTMAGFDSKFRDKRNRDNIVAKRGALFMVNLKHEVQRRGFTVAHIKTDSIKIPNATPEIIQFVMDFGKEYGYNFEHEATYDRMCLVNDAVYIAKYADNYNDGAWTATGAQFQQPFVFKTLFTKEPIEFRDLCETKSVSTAIYLDMNEKLPDVTAETARLKKLQKLYPNPEEGSPEQQEMAELEARIAKGHCYQFVGKVGLFSPIRPNCGGGRLVREKGGKFDSVSGSIGYRWLESEVVRLTDKEADIDRTFYTAMADKAIDTISAFGSFEDFVSGTRHDHKEEHDHDSN